MSEVRKEDLRGQRKTLGRGSRCGCGGSEKEISKNQERFLHLGGGKRSKRGVKLGRIISGEREEVNTQKEEGIPE